MNESAVGYLSRVDGVFGGFTIAHDWDAQVVGVQAGFCIIEDATGGGSDRLTGMRLVIASRDGRETMSCMAVPPGPIG